MVLLLLVLSELLLLSLLLLLLLLLLEHDLILIQLLLLLSVLIRLESSSVARIVIDRVELPVWRREGRRSIVLRSGGESSVENCWIAERVNFCNEDVSKSTRVLSGRRTYLVRKAASERKLAQQQSTRTNRPFPILLPVQSHPSIQEVSARPVEAGTKRREAGTTRRAEGDSAIIQAEDCSSA